MFQSGQQLSAICFCSSLGQSAKPWRFNSSRIQSLWGPWADSFNVSIRSATSGTWLARVTFLMLTLMGITIGWRLRFLRQAGTQEEPGCNSPYMMVSTMEVGSVGPCDSSVSMWTHMEYPWTSVLPLMFIVPNRGMATIPMVQKCPWMTCRWNPSDIVVSGAAEGSLPTGPLPPCSHDHTKVCLLLGHSSLS